MSSLFRPPPFVADGQSLSQTGDKSKGGEDAKGRARRREVVGVPEGGRWSQPAALATAIRNPLISVSPSISLALSRRPDKTA